MSIEVALSKLRSAQICHPNAVQFLIDEAITAITAIQRAEVTDELLHPEDFNVEVVMKPMGGFAPVSTQGVRVTHKPTGTSVTCDAARSQHTNRHHAFEQLRAILAQQPATDERLMGQVSLPDGSAFAIASFPLPKAHWLYAPREYATGAEEPLELPTPILTHDQREAVVAAIRYAVRGATMCGREQDFDPDAMVQNAVYALCGPYARVSAENTQASVNLALSQKPATGEPVACANPDGLKSNWHAHHVIVNKAALQMVRNALRNDVERGLKVRGEMLAELDLATFQAHPAPSVPDDSKRLDYLQDRGATIDLIPGVADFYPMQFRVGGLHSSANTDVRAAIDAASVLTAAQAQKGQP